MNYHENIHLTYCTNVHPAEDWRETFETLQAHVLPLKDSLAPSKPFGIGLRLSALAARELLQEDRLATFKQWLDDHDLYVFTMNGFPYGTFHRRTVKDDVHRPDWTTKERLAYTLDLVNILAVLLPKEMESGSISTSPISYRLWEVNIRNRKSAIETACGNFAVLAEKLYRLHQEKQIQIQMAIEPEPDGLLENCAEAVLFFREDLIPKAGIILQKKLKISFHNARKILLTYIGVCYDICHSALLYEDPVTVLENFQKQGIEIAKVQISSALKVPIPDQRTERKKLLDRLHPFAGSVYLHQVIAKKTGGSFERYPDLAPALESIYTTQAEEWRIHFHVPVFVTDYQDVSSTRQHIEKTLAHLEKNPFTQHLEIETYTWEVLPRQNEVSLTDWIQREYLWVLEKRITS